MSFGQYDYGFLQEFYFGRQANARAEALGMAYSSIDGDIATIGYNPAGTSTLKGAEIMSSIASPLYTLENAEHSYIAAGYNINQYLTIGISRNHFNYGQEITISDAGGQPTGEFTPKTSLYTLNVSSQPIENLMVGINANYLIFDPVDNPAKSLYFDLGVIKKFELWQNLASTHSINLGASISNLNYAETEIEYNGIKSEEDLPVIARFGLNYQLQLDKNWFSDTLNTFNFLIQADYQSLMNSDYHNGIYSGLELTFLEVLSARIGYYQESQFDFDIPSANKDEISALTYGFGLQLPLDKLTKIPLRINFDYTNLPQPSYTKADWNWDNFLSYTLRVNWMLN
jgi:hypothetical protein